MSKAKGGIEPKDQVDAVRARLDQESGRWVSPKALWSFVQSDYPDLASLVKEKISGYGNPSRNNEVWFISNALYHVQKLDGYRLSDIEKVPEMKGESLWLVARAESR